MIVCSYVYNRCFIENNINMWERFYITFVLMNLDYIRKKEVFSEDVFLKIGIFKVSNLMFLEVFVI